MADYSRNVNQARSYCKNIAQLFYSIMTSKQPADRILKGFFRENKQCGSRDRRFISEAVYGLFRWYGWLKDVLPDEEPAEPFDDDNFIKGTLLVLSYEGQAKSAAYSALLDKAGVVTPEITDFQSKLNSFEKFFLLKPDLTSLVPDWIKGSLSESQIMTLQGRPPVWLRVKASRLDEVKGELNARNVDFMESSKIPGALKLLSRVNLNEMKTYRQGAFEVQDLASQCLALACDAKPGEEWWDVCAGGGGKSLAIAEQLNNRGLVVATDKRKWILDEVKKRSRRNGYKIIKASDLNEIHKGKVRFDGVLIDAPCSCSGTWRRNPDTRWLAASDICQTSAKIQRGILQRASAKVLPGGKLVYATCSLSAVENEDVVQDFLESNEDFKLDSFTHPLTGEVTDGMLYVESMPEDCDTMFAARMIRK